MNILYTLNSGDLGGMEYHTVDLAKGMTSRGHSVFVCCMEGPLAEMFRKVGAKVFILNVRFDLDLFYMFKVRQIINDNEIEIVHSHGLKSTGNVLLASFISDAHSVVSHIHTPFTQWPVPKFKRFIYSKAYAIAVRLFSSKEIALTEVIKGEKMNEGIPESKLSVIPNAFETSKFVYSEEKRELFRLEMSKKYNFPENKFILGNTSRLSENKGINELLEAYSQLCEAFPSFKDETHLLLAGKSEIADEVRSQIKDLGIEKNVTLTGTFPDEDHIKLYNCFDLFVFPTKSEGFGLVLIEAMALKIPVICSDLPVLQEVVGDHVYKYFDSNDVASVREAIKVAYENSDKLHNLVDDAQKFVFDKYSMGKFINNYENLYISLLEDSQQS